MRMRQITLLAATALAVLAAPAMAEDKVKDKGATPAAEEDMLQNLEASRIGDDQIRITFSYTGGVCEEVGEAEVGEIVDGTLAVTFPTVSTAEVCTMQAVEIAVDQTVQASSEVATVDVTLTRPDGAVMGTGSTEVEQD